MNKKIYLPILLSALIVSCSNDNTADSQNKKNSNEEQLVKNSQSQSSKPRNEAKQWEYIEVSKAEAMKVRAEHDANSSARQKNALYASKRASQSQMGIQNYAPQPLLMPQDIQYQENEKYKSIKEQVIKLVSEAPVSTFSIDVDTASYSNVRRILNQGDLPRHDVVRIEELVNYFSYDYPKPDSQSTPFSVYREIGPSPYNKDKLLLHIGIQGRTFEQDKRPASNLVFLIDVSGSMKSPNKIGLLKNSLKMLTKQLNKNDKVAIVVYAGAAGTVLEPTSGDNYIAITDALNRLSAGGSTNGGAGIEAAYNLARQSYIKDGINRVILATDGDFNVGTVNQNVLKELIVKERKSGIDLSILGLGQGNYNDALMQELAQNGNGNAYYIDTLNEARKVLVEELSATLVTIAKDVKIQIEFNPSLVSEYRLIGYETRALKRQDFNNDKVDAGDIGAGHTVTAIYEISLTDGKNKSIDPLRYQEDKIDSSMNNVNELAFLRLRYKEPKSMISQLIEIPIHKNEIKLNMDDTSETYQFSAAVAGFAQLLKGGEYLSNMDIEQVIKLAKQSKGEDQFGYRSEFVNMVKLAEVLSPSMNNTGDVTLVENRK